MTILQPVCAALLCAPAAFCQDVVPVRAEPKASMIERVAASIRVHEGWNDLKSLVRRQHNPGALVYAGQPGARQGKNGYAWFETDADGMGALLADLRAKARLGMTLRQVMNCWSAKSYGRQVARETGIREDAVLR